MDMFYLTIIVLGALVILDDIATKYFESKRKRDEDNDEEK